jgi:endoglucanase
MRRRDLLQLAGGLGLAATMAAGRTVQAQTGPVPAARPQGDRLTTIDWQRFAARFILPEGRVSDSGNGGISHSEGQGYSMLLAVAADDRARFDSLWNWTRTNLLVRDDGLTAWKWVPGKGVTDINNATDGDILIAWALLRAADLWSGAEHREAALALLQAIRRIAVVEHGGMTLLLPGVAGFRQGTGIVVNPSYWIFPALAAFAAAEPDPAAKEVWARVVEGGLILIAKARFGQVQLPPDWVRVEANGGTALPDGFKHQFGYDAIRVPLYLAWGGYRDPYYFRPYAAFTARFGDGPIPATISLPGGTTAKVPASVGMLAVHRLASHIAATGGTVTVPPPGEKEDYYSTVLILLVQVTERSLGLVP